LMVALAASACMTENAQIDSEKRNAIIRIRDFMFFHSYVLIIYLLYSLMERQCFLCL